MYDLDKRIDEYSEELFADLGLVTLPEEKKAEIYARVQEHLHRLILEILTRLLNQREIAKTEEALEQENYHALGKILKRHPKFKNELEQKINQELANLKLTITKEQKNVRATEERKLEEGDSTAI